MPNHPRGHSRPHTASPSPALVVALVALAVLMVASCGGAPASPGQITPSEPLATASAEPPVPDATITPELLEAMAFRRSMGLRSDAAWAQAVAANPEAVLDWGVPLLPFEIADIESRATGDDSVVTAVQTYLGSHPDISGGLYLDQSRGGVITMLVTQDPAGHEAAVRAVIGADTPLIVREVRWTEQELNDLQERIFMDQAFLGSIPAFASSGATDVMENVVVLTISSAVPDAAARIAEHFGAEEGQLRVTSDGTGILLQPTGRIEGRIIAPPGVDVQALSPQYEADVDIGVRDAVGIGVDPDGTFTIERLPPTTYTVTILEAIPGDAGNRVAGSARVTVPPGGVGFVEIEYKRP